ncbi:FMN-dependent NADH-azoreductase [Alteromonas sp. MB-3u-76]|jgi:FMN-dependent NADH-azoreductase|uniref:FMN-dependent NADH-azoreductase n=1 Tax=Alteromonas sp. MB-3u-76 TaxID=2058133 RepID=UPI000C30F328|nr:NAD(P)H-dependent oxidoreductase [Alteromonas sp. MB-3u-76]AUC88075.1 FMN-dependent NADH-azoreductase [Alteromonas sp. MB-3u-76]
MSNVLFIKSSLNGNKGNSNILGNLLVAKLKEEKSANIVERDLAADALPHLTQAEMASWAPDSNNQELASFSDTLIDELKASDTVVIAMPMYNFGVPSTFKAWVDRIARAGVTFQYTENGPVGLLENKKIIVVAARGGIYEGTQKDTQSQHLKDFFGLIGLTDISFIYAEGLAMPDGEERMNAAKQAISEFKF